VKLGNQIFDNRFEKLEIQIGFKLPETFKELLRQYNGINLIGTEINGIDINYGDSSLDKLYHNEHFEVEYPMPLELFPFSPDGRGNHYCFDLSLNNDKVLFWQHDFNYSDKSEIEVCNNSFLEWVKEVLIDWTLEDYNYDGSEK
jgi:hypothetical protein